MNIHNFFKNISSQTLSSLCKGFLELIYSKEILTPISLKTLLTFTHDIIMAFFALFFAIYLKIGSEFLDFSSSFLIKNFFVFLLIFSGISVITQSYKTVWKNITNKEITKIATTSAVSNILFLPTMFLMSLEDESFPFIIPIINIFVLVCLIISPRIIIKFYHDYKIRREQIKKDYAPIILVGKNKNIEHFINEIPHICDFPYIISGIITTDKNLDEQEINEHKILGVFDDIESIFLTLKAKKELPPYIMLVDENLEEKKHKTFIQKAQEYKMIVLKTIHKLTFSVVSVDNKAV